MNISFIDVIVMSMLSITRDVSDILHDLRITLPLMSL